MQPTIYLSPRGHSSVWCCTFIGHSITIMIRRGKDRVTAFERMLPSLHVLAAHDRSMVSRKPCAALHPALLTIHIFVFGVRKHCCPTTLGKLNHLRT